MVRHPLVRPGRFFAERIPLGIGSAVGVVVLIALVTTATTGLLGWLFASQLTGTITVENEERPPEWVCDGEQENNSVMGERCDQPKQRNVSASSLLWQAFSKRLPLAFVAPLIGWIVMGVVLHLLSSAFGGQNGVDQTLAVTAWGMLPSIFRAIAVLVGAYIILQGMTLASDPQVLLQQLESLRGLSRGPLVLIGLIESVWQGIIWTVGLKHAREMELADAGIAAGLVALGVFVMGLVT